MKKTTAIALVAALSVTSIPLRLDRATANPAVAGACFIPGVGWVSCAIVGTVLVGAGALWYVVTINGQQTQLPQSYVHRMLDDPEAPSETYTIDYVWADSVAEAIKQCRDIARRNGVGYAGVRRTSRSGNKWECNVSTNSLDAEPRPQQR